jgi:hypothetical protein
MSPPQYTLANVLGHFLCGLHRQRWQSAWLQAVYLHASIADKAANMQEEKRDKKSRYS